MRFSIRFTLRWSDGCILAFNFRSMMLLRMRKNRDPFFSTIVSRSLLVLFLGVSAAGAKGPGAGSIGLESLLEHASNHSPLLLTAQARVHVAEARVAGANPFFPSNPVVSGSLGRRSSGGNSGTEFEVSLSQQLEISGARGLRKDAARAQVRMNASAAQEASWLVHVEVHRLFNELLMAKERRAQAERFVAFSESLQNIATRQIEAGEMAPITLLVADAELAQTRALLIEAVQAQDVLDTQLQASIGWSSTRPLRLEGSLPVTRRAPRLASLLELMSKSHPSLKTRRDALVASNSLLQLEQRKVWPKPTVGVSYGQEPSLANQPGAEILLFNLSVPIPLWQRNQGGVARAQALVQVAKNQESQTVIRLKSELGQALVALNAAADRVALYDKSVIPQLEKNLALLQRAFELGEVDLLQVSQTRARLLGASRQYVDARISYYKAAATLEGFVGVDFLAHPKEEK